MSSSGRSGQRQDVALLALAVAFLAVALALFVGLRSIQRSKSKEPEPEPVAQVQEAEPEEEAPKSEGGRDPFRTQAGSLQSATAPGPAIDLRLVGIVTEKGDEPMAILRSGRRRYYAKVGERAGGYTVVGIGENRAVLEQDGRRITLVLRPPPEQ